MANEVTTSVTFSVLKSGATAALTTSKSLDMAGTDVISATQNIGFAADEALVFGDVAQPAGMCEIKNLDATNYVTLSIGTGGAFAAGAFAIIRAGAPMLYQPASAAVYAQANTASVQIQVAACEV